MGVAACQAQNHAPGAAQKDQSADARDGSQQETDDGRGAAARFVFAKSQRGCEGPQNHAQDFRTQILDNGGPVQAHRPRDVAVEADHADAHIARIARMLEQNRQSAENQARDRNARGGGKNVESRFHENPPGYGRACARCERRSVILTGYADGDFRKSGLPDEEKTQFPAPPSAYAPRREAQCFASGLVQKHGRFLTGLRAPGRAGTAGCRSIRGAKEASKRG